MRMPQNEHEKLRISTDYYNISRFPKVIGCVDGTYIRIQSPGGDDAEVFRNRKGYFSINTQYWLIILGDSGYANRNYLLVPLLNPSNHAEELYNEAHIRTRNTIERLFGVWKRRFPILAYGLRYKPELASDIIVATGILHNVAKENNEDEPPLAENINAEELNYLIELGNIPDVIERRNPENRNAFDQRRHLIEHYFIHL
ncbi:putative nuclease HARBI1 [Anthonomus grandis grandis]|uniref:putative nuclease HARBI1 n=1 Tax=Anthonomus grandis grandis TaxID=2921223 RepID=UPI002165E548|nr:putative nuclease HARBI1 [Anthonomus grandis grandis]